MKPNVTNFIKSAQDVFTKHSPEILAGIGVAGMISATVLAVKATPKALKLIEKAKEEKGEDLTVPETIKAAWKPYIPAVVTSVVSAGCIIGGTSVNLKRNAALATAYQLSSNALAEYKEKVVETIGEKKEKVIREKIAAEKVEKNPVKSNEVIITGKGTTLCYDSTFGKYFESDIESIRRAINDLNYRLLCEDYVSLNDFYDELGIERIPIGEEVGWNVGRDGTVEVSFGTAMSSDGRPCITLEYHVAPRYKFHKYND